VASKFLLPSGSHSLQDLLIRHLRIKIAKDLQTSDWSARPISFAHFNYMVNDVQYLLDLFDVLRHELEAVNRWRIAEKCFSFIPARVELKRLGLDDVFAY